MPKILVMNAGTQQMSGGRLTTTQSRYAAFSALRNVWFARAGDIIISPLPIDREVLHYVCEQLLVDVSSIRVITPRDHRHRVLSDDRLLSPSLVTEVLRYVSQAAEWRIEPCYFTVGVARLARLCGIESSAASFAGQFGCDLFNRKSHFRQLAVGSNLLVAEGIIVFTRKSCTEAIHDLIERTGTVIVKKDNGAGGAGNITITKAAVMQLPGSRVTRNALGNLSELIAELWPTLQDRWSPAVVVEAYYPAAHRFYVEFNIDERGTPFFTNSGTIRLSHDLRPGATEMIWCGLDLPADIPIAQYAEAVNGVGRFASLAASIGYRGPLNVDAIITQAGDLVYNEANGRWGGGSVMHEVSVRLLGPNTRRTLSSVRDVQAESWSCLCRAVEMSKLSFNLTARTGILVLACDGHITRTAELLLIGKSPTQVRAMERRFVSVLKQHAA